MIHQRAAKRQRGDQTPSLEEAQLRQQAIGVRLRQIFDAVVSEPVPEEFLRLLQDADERRSEEG
ncbi:MAG TPA: NepR family anti-sigma factor [Caulobacteraceae bacterium]|nr:NepR family anti-sigma factor [Caulobacteraceae bacterium]